MKLSNPIFFIILVAIIASCDSKSFKTNENGLKYVIHKDSAGTAIKEGDVVTLSFNMKNSKDSIISTSEGSPRPFALPMRKPQFKGSIEEGLLMLSKGDSATFLVKADSMFKQGPMPAFIAKGSEVRFDVKIKNVQNQEDYQKEQMAYMQKEQERMQKESQEHIAIDDKLITDHLTKNNIKATKTSTGLYYTIEKEGTGPQPAVGDSVEVAYTGKLLDGKVFDSSEGPGKGPFKFPVGVRAVIPGWDEGLMLLKQGSKAKLFIPSALGYGPRQAGPDIKPNSVLIFDVELVKVTKKK